MENSFLGTKYKRFTCKSCKKKYEDIGLNKRPDTCPMCDNNVNILDEVTDPSGCNCYSCQAGRAIGMAERKLNEDNI